ncbi:hypothetical protein F0562_011027 [Nyssa sinensis]|uniref:Uncharacterized protein n=1 Tax=Nyssa sinensis TaxID=561372 RepID=A0A5J5A321_9ASTE|nr:hypothetical protein F0562_011027 [Nyssa sinensis]
MHLELPSQSLEPFCIHRQNSKKFEARGRGWQHRAVESSLVHVLPLTFSNGNTMKRTVIVSSMELAIFGTFLHSQLTFNNGERPLEEKLEPSETDEEIGLLNDQVVGELTGVPDL